MPRRRALVKKPALGGIDARQAALNALLRITLKRLALDQSMEEQEVLALESRDRAFFKQLVMLCLKHHGQMKFLLRQMLADPNKALPQKAEWIFLLGMAQLMWMDVPDYAAINTSVNLAKDNRISGFSGLINAVLKRVAHEKGTLMLPSPLENLPEWLRHMLEKDYGSKEAEFIAEGVLKEAPLDLTLKPDFAFETAAGDRLPTGTWRMKESVAVREIEGFLAGGWWVQDAAACLPVKLLGDIRGKTVLDLCAAPGGKTLQLAAGGASVVALDRSAQRMRRVHENLERTALSAECVIADAKSFAPESPVDFILLDAPCSATGTLRRHPDVLWHRSPQEIDKLSNIQRGLLSHAASLLSSGGKLVYCVCSILKAEGEAVVLPFLEQQPQLRIVPPQIAGVPESWISPEGFLRTQPHYWQELGGMDGFFMACFEKK